MLGGEEVCGGGNFFKGGVGGWCNDGGFFVYKGDGKEKKRKRVRNLYFLYPFLFFFKWVGRCIA